MPAGPFLLGWEDATVPGIKRAPIPVVSHACGTWKPWLGSRIGVIGAGRPTVRDAEFPSGTGRSKKRTPAAERQQEDEPGIGSSAEGFA